jgi:acyl-CoA synthetase (AMP-forming)/AMP-acid ligase II
VTTSIEHSTASESASAHLLIDFVAAQADSQPQGIAVSYGVTTWTWSQWHERIRRVASALCDAGIVSGDRIAFIDKVNPACLEVLLAAASLGVVTASINWRLTTDELAYILGDCQPRIVFAGADLAASVVELTDGSADTGVVALGGEADQYEQFLATARGVPADRVVRPDDDALVVYSSGTTGRPKGVLISQRALVEHAVSLEGYWPLSAGDTNFLAAPLFHVAGLSQAMWGIRAGVRTIYSSEMSVASVVDAIAAGASHAMLVAPVIAALIGAHDSVGDAVGRLKYLGYGAAPTPVALVQRAAALWPEVNLVQAYGQTELSGLATQLGPDDHRDNAHPQRLASVGTVVAGVEARVTDLSTGAVLPADEQGELWFRSRYCMSGYLNRPDDTAQTFSADGWLRTGDVGHVDADGYVYIDDRLKDMIITGGENVYSSEVERVLYEHPAVIEAAVIGVPDAQWGESVKAFVTLSNSVPVEEIIEFSRERLAGYKCPKAIEFVTVLPRNAAGKVLKRDLRESSRGTDQSST